MDGVEGCTFADLVASEPKGDATVGGDVVADTTYVNVVFTCAFEGHGVDVVLGIVDEGYSRGSLKGFANLGNSEGFLGFDPDTFGVAAEAGDTDAGG